MAQMEQSCEVLAKAGIGWLMDDESEDVVEARLSRTTGTEW